MMMMIRHQYVLQQVHGSCTQSYTHFAWRRVNNLVINGDDIQCWFVCFFLCLICVVYSVYFVYFWQYKWPSGPSVIDFK